MLNVPLSGHEGQPKRPAAHTQELSSAASPVFIGGGGPTVAAASFTSSEVVDPLVAKSAIPAVGHVHAALGGGRVYCRR